MQLQSGTLLQGGKYKIERVLGQGGFGITYLAKQELFDRHVCIKEFFFNDYCERGTQGEVTSCTTNSKELVDRFLNKFIKEARTISRLDHPNIVRILDIFQENGTAYYAMEYIEGYSLADKVNAQGALSEAVAVDYIKQVASALDYIHQRSINHLDVKPANIMVRQSDNKAILIDFGLSKQYDEQGGQTSTTPVGISHGYAPMEQYNQGGVSTFSPQTDIYSLGATLYKLVTGNTPPQAIEIFNEGLTGLPQSLSPNLATAIRKTMQPKKGDRPQSIGEFTALLGGQFATNASSANAQNDVDESTKIIEEVIKTSEQMSISLSQQNENGRQNKDKFFAIKKWTRKFFRTYLIVCCILLGVILLIDSSLPSESSNNTTTNKTQSVQDRTSSQKTGTSNSKIDISYYTTKDDIFNNLYIKINGQSSKVNLPNDMCLSIASQRDFDGDGIKDALITNIQACGGNSSGNTFFFVKYNGKRIIVTEEFGYDVYENPKIELWNGKPSVVIKDHTYNPTHQVQTKRYVLSNNKPVLVAN